MYASALSLIRKLDLTPKQEKFVQLYVTADAQGMSPAECAVEAGYSKKTAAVIAANLVNPARYPKVVEKISLLREQFNQKYQITYGNHLRKLGQIRDACIESKAWTGAVNAEIARGKAAGLYVERKEILHGSLDKMSEKELQNELERLMAEFSTVVDVTAEEVEEPIAIKA